MEYDVKSEILGFEAMNRVRLSVIDETFASLRDVDNEKISFTLVNPFKLREYAVDIPSTINELLEIGAGAKFSVYAIVLLQNPLDESRVNFLAPLIFNHDNHTVAQAVLVHQEYPEFGVAESIRSLIKEA
ncbi:MAG: flagellar assembly protein FliW [Campylobacterales bacterium]|nr:flagellar assembly protein FliW [Campylobacterales bacterium]